MNGHSEMVCVGGCRSRPTSTATGPPSLSSRPIGETAARTSSRSPPPWSSAHWWTQPLPQALAQADTEFSGGCAGRSCEFW